MGERQLHQSREKSSVEAGKQAFLLFKLLKMSGSQMGNLIEELSKQSSDSISL